MPRPPVIKSRPSWPTTAGYEVAKELMETELRRLARDHYSDSTATECDGCNRALAIADWLGLTLIQRNRLNYTGGREPIS